MEDKGKPIAETSVGEMRKRRETMPDGKRYIIYYTFDGGGENSETMTPKTSETENAEASENV
ncbi:MAG TPA: hypothetical protein VEQ34_07460 [Pyrinomonadaceae bacterium]|nr:hypothetical protein [Pyrinomonadaceae bacterium]